MTRYTLDAINTSGTTATALNLSQWISVSESTSKSQKDNILVASYGDGYTQVARNGINSSVDKWNLTFVPLIDGVPIGTSYLTSMRTFLASIPIGNWFFWTPLGETTVKKWRVDKDSIVSMPISQTRWSFTFSITQVFDLT